MPRIFTAMTWNVENLFPPGYPLSPQHVVTQAEYEAKLDYVAQMIETLAPDVLALQEIGGRSEADTQAFADLQERVHAQYFFGVLSSHPDGRGIRVAFLSRLPLHHTQEIVQFAPGELSQVPDWNPAPPITRMGRGALCIEVEPSPGVRIRLLTLHLKSKLISYPRARGESSFSPRDEHERTIGEGLALLRRTAEAVAVRFYLNGVMTTPDSPHTIVLGDFNDEPRAATSQLVLGPADADATSADKLDPVRLYNLVDAIPRRGGEAQDKRFLPEQERVSRLYQGHRELIDHILVSKGLLGQTADLKQDRWQVQEVRSVVENIQGQSVDDNPAGRVNKDHPDHAPVYARFMLED